MNHVITCNPIGEIKSLKNEVDNFIVCHFHEYDAKFYLTKKTKPIFDLYVQDEYCDAVEELLTEYEREQVNVYEVPSLSVIPEVLVQNIGAEYNPDDLLDENSDKELPCVYLCADTPFSTLMASSLNREFRKNGYEIEVTNLMKYYQTPSFDRLVDMMKRELETEFIYKDDPVQFAFVTNFMLRGGNKGWVM